MSGEPLVPFAPDQPDDLTPEVIANYRRLIQEDKNEKGQVHFFAAMADTLLDHIEQRSAVRVSGEFTTLRTANAQRQKEWDTGDQMTLSYSGNELAGEIGELCNVLKKIERERFGMPGSRATVEHAAEELADGIICLDLIGAALGIDVWAAVKAKFNKTSDKHGFATKIEAGCP